LGPEPPRALRAARPADLRARGRCWGDRVRRRAIPSRTLRRLVRPSRPSSSARALSYRRRLVSGQVRIRRPANVRPRVV